MKKISNSLSILLIIGVLAIGSSYMIGILSENDQQMNVSGTGYEDTYNSNVNIQKSTLTFFSMLTLGLGIIFGFKFIRKL